MKLLFVIILLMGMVNIPAYAQNKKAFCNIYQAQRDNGGVNYREGVDAYGNPVVPADASTGQFELPEVINIPINVDLAEYLKDAKVKGLNLDANMGMMKIYPEGKVVANDKDISAQMAMYCGAAQDKPTIQGPTIEAPEIQMPTTSAPVMQPSSSGAPVMLGSDIADTRLQRDDFFNQDFFYDGWQYGGDSVSSAPSNNRLNERPQAIEVKVKEPVPPRMVEPTMN